MLEANSTQNILVQHHLIVITIPMYNEVKYIADTLESVSKQTWTDFKVLISDNASTDGSGEICEAFCKKDDRFHYIRQPVNIGACKNFQFLLDHTESPYFMWLGAHDLLHPNFLETHLQKACDNPSISLSCSAIRWLDEENKSLGTLELKTISSIKGKPLLRYLQAVTSINDNEYNAVNSLIRRNALEGLELEPVFGGDHIVVSRLNYLGLVNYEKYPLYIARCFMNSRNESWMERVYPDDPSRCLDFKLFKEAYLRDFEKIFKNKNMVYGIILKSVITCCIQLRILKVRHTYQTSKHIKIKSFLVFMLVLLVRSILGSVYRHIIMIGKFFTGFYIIKNKE